MVGKQKQILLKIVFPINTGVFKVFSGKKIAKKAGKKFDFFEKNACKMRNCLA